jgi:hypothetical protein
MAVPEYTISELISVCCQKDVSTWEFSAPHIIKNIDALRYTLVVPDDELELFKSISPARFDIFPESNYVGDFKKKLQEKIPSARIGWYLQQFVKISAANGSVEESVLIWDADTVPLTSLHFIDDFGKIVFYKGNEHHDPYFSVIQKLLSLEKIVPFSFIAQCFPTKVSWVNEFCAEIERKYNKPWMDAILDVIEPYEASGFSEYETLGTYISHYHACDYVVTDRDWLRKGGKLYGSVSKLADKDLAYLSNKYDFVSFESWDQNKQQSQLSKLFILIKNVIRSMKLKRWRFSRD